MVSQWLAILCISSFGLGQTASNGINIRIGKANVVQMHGDMEKYEDSVGTCLLASALNQVISAMPEQHYSTEGYHATLRNVVMNGTGQVGSMADWVIAKIEDFSLCARVTAFNSAKNASFYGTCCVQAVSGSNLFVKVSFKPGIDANQKSLKPPQMEQIRAYPFLLLSCNDDEEECLYANDVLEEGFIRHCKQMLLEIIEKAITDAMNKTNQQYKERNVQTRTVTVDVFTARMESI